MVRHPLSNLIVLFALLEVFVKTHNAAHERGHDFITSNHKKYFVDDISSLHEDLSSVVRGSSINDLNMKLLLKFEPEYLDFQERPLGVPHLEKVTLFNVDGNKSIDMTSISGSTVHFHSSFFEDKRIPPLGNTSFNVVFLGREEGAIESNLFIHTTEGHFRYQVKGASSSSPYRLRPIVGIKLPLNTTFSPLINMYNPYTEPIQIVEIYSSGGDFHLELPSGELEGPKNMWEIPPLQTKAIIRVRFNARTEQNHTAYVRIKLNNTEDILVVPLEIEVTSTAGLYVPQGSIDFGVGGSLDAPRRMDLFVQNPLKKAVRVSSVTSTCKAIKIDYENVKVPSDTRTSKDTVGMKVATLTLDWKTAHELKEFSGKIVIKYKNGKSKTEIPFYLTVLEGGVAFNASTTTYFINESPKQMISRNVAIKNNFLQPLAVTNVSLPVEARNYFKIEDFKPVILKPDERATIFVLNLKSDASITNLKLNSFIEVETNISTIQLPLLSYNGKLQISFPYKSKDNSLDLGLVSLDTRKFTYFLVLNTNPVVIDIEDVSSSLTASTVDIIGCGDDNYSLALLLNINNNITKCTSLKTRQYAIVRLLVLSPHAEGQVWGDVVVETQYERLSIPVHYKVAQGKLEIGPDRLVFDQCFPGKICSHPLRVHSTFNEPMVIENIISIPPDPRLSCKHLGHIMARSTKVIGHLYLDPSLGCLNECYSGLRSGTSGGWMQSLTLPNLTAELDLSLVNVLYNRYLNVTCHGSRKWQNLTMRIDTSEVKWHIFKTRVKMSWPSLIRDGNSRNRTVFKFPLTQVGNISYCNITVRNPSSHSLVVQLLFNSDYPNYKSLNDGLPANFLPDFGERLQNRAFFFNEDLKRHSEAFRDKLHLDVHRASLPLLLKAGENCTISVGFNATSSMMSSALMYIRNNLTVMEVVRLSGQGAVPNFKFGNRKPGSMQPLAFELTEKHLKDCEHRKHPSPNLTVKRTFTARNMGDISIFINGFYINGLPCEGYGFKVLNCEPFVLLPNSTKKIDIAFTPDFTLAKVIRTLTLDTSINLLVNYTLVTTVPPSYLFPCSMALARPLWEPYLYYMMLSSMCVLLVFVVAMIVIEAEHTLKQAVVFVSRNSPTTQPTLDLRLVGTQTRNEIKSSTKGDEVKEKKESPEKGSEADIIDLMDSKSKQEGEKYTAIVPTVGKSRKRLSKKNSNEIADATEVNRKYCENVKCKKSEKVEEAKKESEIKEKKVCAKKKLETPVYEEETSSTATEGSNNEEDVKNQSKKSPNLKTSPVAFKVTPAIENYKELNSKIEKKPRRSLQRPKESKEQLETKGEAKTSTETKQKNNKNVKERRKEPLAKKLSLEKKAESHSTNSVVRISPTLQFNNIWSENRASFSDVVARSDHNVVSNGSNPRPPLMQCQNQTAKPTMYVEPYKQTTTDLGPIGSRKSDFHNQENSGLSLHDQHQLNHLSNSFFSDHTFGGVDGQNPFLGFGENWENQNAASSQFLTLMQQPNVAYNNQLSSNPWSQQQNANLNGFWDAAAATHVMNDGFNNHTQQVNQESSYLWGSSSVWQPWAPAEVSRTPTRTPPGFNTNREIEERMQQQNQAYDLFGLTNIWAQQYPNPWNYPQGQ